MDPRDHLNRGYTVAIGADHAGRELALQLRDRLAAVGTSGHQVPVLILPEPDAKMDYPLAAHQVCRAVSDGSVDRGLLICGSGIGMSIAANRHPLIRCALVADPLSAELSRSHNNSNVLSLGARMIGTDMAWACVLTWLRTPFEGGRHAPRLEALNAF